MTGGHAAPAPVHDGSVGGPVARTEPKVRAAAVAASVTPAVLALLHLYVPGAALLPNEVEALLGVAVTGAVTWVAGYLARAVRRIDLPGDEPVPLPVVDGDELVHAVADEVFDRLAAAGLLEVAEPVGPPTVALPVAERAPVTRGVELVSGYASFPPVPRPRVGNPDLFG